MPIEQTLKVLVEKTLQGDFNSVLKEIATKNIKFETNSSIKLLAAICNACHFNMKTPENLNEVHLVELSLRLVKHIKTLIRGDFENYLQSVFYIIRFLIEKKKIECILNLENLLLPKFINSALTGEQQSTYYKICKIICNFIIVNASNQEVKETAMKLIHLLADAFHLLEDKSQSLEIIFNCLNSVIRLNVSSEDVFELYRKFLLTVDKIENCNAYSLFINNFSVVFNHLLKNEKLELAKESYEITITQLDQLFADSDCKILNEVLVIVEWLNPLNNDELPEIAHKNLRQFITSGNYSKNLESVCQCISKVTCTASQVYKKSDKWLNKSEQHLPFYKFLFDISFIFLKIPSKCSCNCEIATKTNEAGFAIDNLGKLARRCITQKEVPKMYQVLVLKFLEKYLDLITKLKKKNCENWKTNFYNCSVHLYSIGIHLLQAKNFQIGILYLQKFIQSVLELEALECQVLDKSYLVAALITISNSYQENQNWEKSLLLVALAIACNDFPKNEILRWINAKSASRSKSPDGCQKLQEMTLVSILANNSEELKCYLPKRGLSLSLEKKIDMLLYELRHYKSTWKTKIPMRAVYKELTELCSTQVAAEIFVEIWGDGDLLVDSELPKLLQETMKKIEKNDDLLMAHLTFLQHKYRVKDKIVKHCDDMERTMSLTQSDKIDTIVPPEPEDECNLNSNYESLKFSHYTKMMEGLKRALDMLQAAVAKKKNYDTNRIFNLFRNIGHEFELHGDVVRALQAWEGALSVARVANNSLHKLQAIAAIIEVASVRKPQTLKLIQEAEKGLPSLSDQTAHLINYYLSKSQAYFNVDFKISYSAFVEVLNLMKDFKMNNLLEARVNLLHHKFILMPCGYQVDGHEDYSLVKIHHALNCINLFFSETHPSAYEMKIFFDIYENASKMYLDLRLPRELRCYAKDSAVLAQKMLLPVRSLQFLCYLIYSDILTNRLEDARSKIDDFNSILDLSTEKENVEMQDLVDDLHNMRLAIPERELNGSPVFIREEYTLPKFLSHELICTCYSCVSFEYQHLILKNTFLKGLLYEYESNEVSRNYFIGVMRIADFLRNRKDVFIKKISKNVSLESFPDFSEAYLEVSFWNLLELGNSFLRKSQLDECKRYNESLLSSLEGYNERFPHVYNEALMQKVNIIICESVEDLPDNPPEQVDDEIGVKTPPSNENCIELLSPDIIGSSFDFKQPLKILPKSLKFDVSDDEEVTEKKKTLPKNLPPTLKHINDRTPVPCSSKKIQIYTDSTTKKSKKSEMPNLLEKPTEISTPALKVDLSSRTKLLTERLKKSSRKLNKEEAAKGSKAIRQNLFESANGEGSGVVRRSARNKK